MAAILPRGIWVNRCTSIADDQVHTYHIISTWPIHTDPVLIWSPCIDSAVEGQLQNTQPYVPCHNSSLPGQRWQQLWWRHQMETFSALMALCVENSPVTGEFPSQRPTTRSFGVFIDQRLNKRLSKPSRRQWFQTPSRSLWRQCNT